jgi:hypothetical protein
MSKSRLEPADEVPERYRQLIRQNDAFVWAVTLALRSGAESAAAATATVRITKRGECGLSRGLDSTRGAA